jgi:hypothetical protein
MEELFISPHYQKPLSLHLVVLPITIIKFTCGTDYKEVPGGPKRTPQQIATEKYNIGGSVIQFSKVKKPHNHWS